MKINVFWAQQWGECGNERYIKTIILSFTFIKVAKENETINSNPLQLHQGKGIKLLQSKFWHWSTKPFVKRQVLNRFMYWPCKIHEHCFSSINELNYATSQTRIISSSVSQKLSISWHFALFNNCCFPPKSFSEDIHVLLRSELTMQLPESVW